MKSFLPILFSFFLLISCSKNPVEWNSEINAPFFKTELSISNLLPDSMLSTDDNHLLSLVVDKELFSLSTHSFSTLPDSIFELYIPLASNIALLPNALLFHKDDVQKMKFEPAEFTKTVIYKGKISFEVINPFNQPIEIHYQIPEAKLNGVALSEKITIPQGSSSGTILTKKIDLKNYELDLRGPNKNSANSYQHILTVRIAPSASDSAHSIGNELLLKIKFEDVELAYAKGYFGQEKINYSSDTTTTHFFDFYQQGILKIEESKTNFIIQNGVGADLQFNLTQLIGFNSHTNQSVAFQSSLINLPINISRATETSNNHAPVIPYIVSYDISNSNILSWITNFPNLIQYAAQLHFNPLGNISAGNDFLYHHADFKVKIHTEIPFSFSASSLALQKEVDFSIGKEIDNINDLQLLLIAENGYPLTCKIQLELIDNMGNTMLTLFPKNRTIESAILNDNNSTVSVKSVLPIIVNKDDIPLLKKHNKMRITAIFDTSNNGDYTPIYDSYTLKLKLTGKVGYIIQI